MLEFIGTLDERVIFPLSRLPRKGFVSSEQMKNYNAVEQWEIDLRNGQDFDGNMYGSLKCVRDASAPTGRVIDSPDDIMQFRPSALTPTSHLEMEIPETDVVYEDENFSLRDGSQTAIFVRYFTKDAYELSFLSETRTPFWGIRSPCVLCISVGMTHRLIIKKKH